MVEGLPLDGVFTLRFFLWVIVPVSAHLFRGCSRACAQCVTRLSILTHTRGQTLWCIAGAALFYALDYYYGALGETVARTVAGGAAGAATGS